jgi:hypothetical protein
MYAGTPTDSPGLPRRVPHSKHARDAVHHPLHVVTCLFNPARYNSRIDLFHDFEKRVHDAGATLTVVRAQVGDRQHYAQSDVRTNYIDLRVDHLQEIWLKENLLNIGVSRLPENAKYIAFLDADVNFVRADWVDATLHALQQYHVVQMFSEAVDLGPTHALAKEHGRAKQMSHAWCYVNDKLGDDLYGGAKVCVNDNGQLIYRHPGFAWAWRREALVHVGGLMDHVLLGSADWHMAWALLGKVEETLGAESESYKRLCMIWQRRAMEHIKGNLGYVDGLLMHYWHGSKSDRGYQTRWKIMADHQFNPDTDLKKDWQGVLRLTDQKPGLRDDVRAYFRARNEDSIDE